MTTSRRWCFRFAIFTVALSVRVAAMQLWPANTGNDASEYLSLAYHLSHSHVYSFGEPHRWGADADFPGVGPIRPTAARAPLYPIFIAALWGLQQTSAAPLELIRSAQAMMGAVTAVLVFEIAAVTVNSTVALIAAFGYCFAPLTVSSGTAVLSETLFGLLQSIAILFWISQRYAFAGMAFGLAILTRAALLPFVVLLSAIYLFQRSKKPLVMPLAALAIVLPWTIRNAVVMQKPILVNSEGWGSTLLQGTLMVPYGSGNPWALYTADPPAKHAIESTPDESQAEEEMLQAAIVRITRNPIAWALARLYQYPRLFLDTGVYVVTLIADSRWNQAVEIVFIGGNAIFLILACYGAWTLRKREHVRPLFFLTIFFMAVNFPVISQPRYSVPLIPILLIFVANALVSGYGKFFKHKQRSLALDAPA